VSTGNSSRRSSVTQRTIAQRQNHERASYPLKTARCGRWPTGAGATPTPWLSPSNKSNPPE
jgi:hypothetical protein